LSMQSMPQVQHSRGLKIQDFNINLSFDLNLPPHEHQPAVFHPGQENTFNYHHP